jgi:hypothetical protein
VILNTYHNPGNILLAYHPLKQLFDRIDQDTFFQILYLGVVYAQVYPG